MQKIFIVPTFLFVIISFIFNADALVWEFDANEGWVAGNNVTNLQTTGGYFSFDTTGSDPNVFTPDNLNVSGSNFRYIHFDMELSATPTEIGQIYFITNADGGWAEDKVIYFTPTAGRNTYLINVPQTMSANGKDPNKWLGQTIKRLRFDPPNNYYPANVKIYWFGITFGSVSDGAVWSFDTNGDFEGWGSFNCATNQQVTGGYLYFQFTCGDPFVHSPYDLRINGSYYPWLQADIEYAAAGNDSFQMLFITTADGNWTEAKSILFNGKVGRHTYLINVPQRLTETGKNPADWNGKTIMQIRFDPGGQPSGNIRIYYIGLRREPIPDWQFNVGNHKQGWTDANQISNFQANNDILSFNTTGGDPYIRVHNQHFNPTDYRYLLIRENITGYQNNDPAGMQTFGFPGTGGTGFVQKDYYFYPNNGYQCQLVDMGSRTSNASWLGAPGTISSFRIDPAWEATPATFYYDSITLYNSLTWATGPYTWDFSTPGNNNLYGNNCGNWVSAKHTPYSGTVLNIDSGVATITGTGTLGIENLGFVVGDTSTYRWIQIDVNPSTQTDRNDFTFRYLWRKDGLRLGDDNNMRRKWTITTNKGTKRYNFYLPYTADQDSNHNGVWDGFPHGILLQFGEGETGINSVTVDNFNILSSASVPPPSVAEVKVISQRIVDVSFTNQIDSSTISTSVFTISGTGRGTLSVNPFSVTYLTGHTYRLTWIAGEMRDGGDVTITVSNTVKDSAGRNLTSPTSGTHTNGGIKIDSPTISTVTSPATANTLPIVVSYTGVADTSSGVNQIELWYKKGDTGTWTDSGLRSSSAPNGSFNFNSVTGEDRYYFDVVVIDNAGNRSENPSGNGRTSTIYDITAPTVGAITVSPYTNLTPVPIGYGSATDNLSGVASYKMYYKLGAGGTWTELGINLDPAGGSVDFSVPGNIEGTYYVALRAVDAAGNDTGAPVGNGQASFVFDVTRPLNLSSVVITPPYANASALPVQVSYTGAADALSGLDYVRLWYRKGLAGVWTDTGSTLTTPDGTFNFAPPLGEGLYYLLVQPVDRAGNGRYVSGNGDGTTVYDNTAPTVGTVSSPDYASGAGISVGYTSASDGSVGSGVSSYRLWYKLESGSWTEYSVALNVNGGNITFVAPGGTNGRYYFDLRACDAAGNCSAVPTGNGQDSTLFDTVQPVNGTASSPAYSKWPVTVSYSGASDALSGLDNVRLYYKRGTGTWTASSLTSSSGSGSFAFTGTQDGTYYFAVVARDRAGNVGNLPVGNGDTTTVVDNVVPTVGSLSVSSATKTVPVPVNYSGCTDNVGGSGINVVKMWYKLGEGGVWTDSGLSSGSGSGSFSFNEVTMDGRYYFGLEVIDKAGNSSGVPSGNGLGSVLVDRTAPSLGTIVVVSPTNVVPISVGYSGCVDGGIGLSEVRLWYKYGVSGVWTDSGLSSASGSGIFNFSDVSGDGVYYFGLQALDGLGNDTGVPVGSGLGSVLLDRLGPEVTVDSKVVTERMPELTGTVEDLSGVVSVVVWVDNHEYVAVVLGNQWVAQVTHPLRRGVYDVDVEAEDVLGQKGYDNTVDELFVDVGDPWVTIDRLITNDATPLLTGEMGSANPGLDVVRVTVTVGSYTNTAELDTVTGVWRMEVGVPLAEGVYDVMAEVEDSGSNISWDTTADELEIDLTAPSMVVLGPEPAITTGEPVRYVVRYIGVREVTLGAEDVELLVRNGDVNAGVAIRPLDKDLNAEYELVLSNFEGNGEVALHILPGTAVDSAGNYAPEYIGGYTLTVSTQSGLPVSSSRILAVLALSMIASVVRVFYLRRRSVR